jgi:ketosteroid isomerase-like protein
MSEHAFRHAVEAGDVEGAMELLRDDVVLHSPIAFRPFEGRDQVEAVLRLVLDTFEDFRYVEEVADGPTVVLMFETRVGDRQVQGIDHIHTDADGRIDQFTVMVRPLSAAIALAEAMGPKVLAAGIK